MLQVLGHVPLILTSHIVIQCLATTSSTTILLLWPAAALRIRHVRVCIALVGVDASFGRGNRASTASTELDLAAGTTRQRAGSVGNPGGLDLVAFGEAGKGLITDALEEFLGGFAVGEGQAGRGRGGFDFSCEFTKAL